MKAGMQSKVDGVLMLITTASPYFERMKIDYVDELERELCRDTGQGMFRFNKANLDTPKVRFYALSLLRPPAPPLFAAGLHVDESADDALYFKGALVAQPFRGQGLMTYLLRLVRTLDGAAWPDKAHRAVVRVFPNGQPNMASLRAFQTAGFAVRGAECTYVLQFSDADRHLAASAEGNGTSIRYLVLEAPGCSNSPPSTTVTNSEVTP